MHFSCLSKDIEIKLDITYQKAITLVKPTARAFYCLSKDIEIKLDITYQKAITLVKPTACAFPLLIFCSGLKAEGHCPACSSLKLVVRSPDPYQL
jgi:hypothetical protein